MVVKEGYVFHIVEDRGRNWPDFPFLLEWRVCLCLSNGLGKISAPAAANPLACLLWWEPMTDSCFWPGHGGEDPWVNDMAA